MTSRIRTVARPLAALGILLSAGVAVLYYWYLAPLRRLARPEYRLTHTRAEVCTEVFRAISRFGFTHDETLELGRCGDREWVARIVTDPGLPGLLTQFDGHVGTALQVMTNQDISKATDWVAWWTANQNLSQAQWIHEGFRHHGLDLHSPLTQQDYSALLRNLAPETSTPPGWRYNSYRILRQVPLTPLRDPEVTSILESADPTVIRGLLRYTQMTTAEAPGAVAEIPLFASTRTSNLIGAALAVVALLSLVVLRTYAREDRASAV